MWAGWSVQNRGTGSSFEEEDQLGIIRNKKGVEKTKKRRRRRRGGEGKR
jgi:hypothetical protein